MADEKFRLPRTYSQLVEAYGSAQALYKQYLWGAGLSTGEIIAVEQHLTRDAILLAMVIKPLGERLTKIEAAIDQLPKK